jgi:hypothetical protein
MLSHASYLRGSRLVQVDRIERFRYLLVRSLGDVWQRRQKAKAAIAKKSGVVVPARGGDPRPEESKFNEAHPSCLFRVYSDPASGLKWAPLARLRLVRDAAVAHRCERGSEGAP